MKLEYRLEPIERLLDVLEKDLSLELRACYPRDLVQQVIWTARYRQVAPRLDDESLDLACRTYFVSR